MCDKIMNNTQSREKIFSSRLFSQNEIKTTGWRIVKRKREFCFSQILKLYIFEQLYKLLDCGLKN